MIIRRMLRAQSGLFSAATYLTFQTKSNQSMLSKDLDASADRHAGPAAASACQHTASTTVAGNADVPPPSLGTAAALCDSARAQTCAIAQALLSLNAACCFFY